MKISVFLILLLFLLAAPFNLSCAKGRFVDDVACEDIAKSSTGMLNDGLEYSRFENVHTQHYFDTEHNCDDHFAVYSANEQDVSEIGVFHATSDDSADRLERLCVEYIDDIKEDSRAFVASYAPDQLPKLDNAQVRRFGNYVIYTVLPEKEAEDVFDAIKQKLKK